MNILLITHIFPPAIDGGSRVIAKVGEYLNKNGHQITVLTTNCRGTDDFVNPKSKPLSNSNALKFYRSIYRLPVYKFLRRPLKLIELILRKIFLVNSDFYLINLLKVAQKGPILKLVPFIKTIHILNSQKFDLIIAGPLPTTITIYANLLKKIFKTKLMINSSFHPTDPDFHNLCLIKSLQQTDYLWSLTEYEKKYFLKNLKLTPEKIINAGNGVDPPLLIPESKIKFPKNPNLLFIGSLAQHKRIELLIESFLKLSTNFPQLTLTIAGQKTLYFPKIEQYLQNIPSTVVSKIKFEFSFSQTKLTNLIDNCTVLILPSVQESFGLVLIESWSRGKPVIVSNIPPLLELIKKSKGGLSFTANSPESLEKQLKFLLNHPYLCQNLGKNGLEYVKNNYTWPQVVDKLCQNIFY